MALIDQWTAAYVDSFVRKVQTAMIVQAKIVQLEDETSLTLPAGVVINQQQLHDKRSELAFTVLRDPESWAKLFAIAASANANISDVSTDVAIQAEIATCWNHIALNGAD